MQADYIREMRDAGYAHLSAAELTELFDHGVQPDYVREMEREGTRGATAPFGSRGPGEGGGRERSSPPAMASRPASRRTPLYPMPTRDPSGAGELIVTRLECPASGVVLEGLFGLGWIGALSIRAAGVRRQLVRHRGNVQRLAGELNVAYNTARSRLNGIVAALDAPGGVPGRVWQWRRGSAAPGGLGRPRPPGGRGARLEAALRGLKRPAP